MAAARKCFENINFIVEREQQCGWNESERRRKTEMVRSESLRFHSPPMSLPKKLHGHKNTLQEAPACGATLKFAPIVSAGRIVMAI
jgi:hypothetical protein